MTECLCVASVVGDVCAVTFPGHDENLCRPGVCRICEGIRRQLSTRIITPAEAVRRYWHPDRMPEAWSRLA